MYEMIQMQRNQQQASRRPRTNRRGGGRSRRNTTNSHRRSRSSAPGVLVQFPHINQQHQQKQNNNGSSSAIIYRDQLGSVSATSSAINSNSNANGGIGNNNTKEVVELIPQVAMLMRGERIPTVPTEMSPRIKSKDKKIRGLSDYREQIQICVANPGRFMASWCLLTTLFGEAELYDYVHKCAWSEEDLKPFTIMIYEGEDEDEENEGGKEEEGIQMQMMKLSDHR